MTEKIIGEVTHFFPNIDVAVIKAKTVIKSGDKVIIKNKAGDVSFEQVIGSMQVDHKPVKSAKAKDEFGLKVDNPVKEGYLIIKA